MGVPVVPPVCAITKQRPFSYAEYPAAVFRPPAMNFFHSSVLPAYAGFLFFILYMMRLNTGRDADGGTDTILFTPEPSAAFDMDGYAGSKVTMNCAQHSVIYARSCSASVRGSTMFGTAPSRLRAYSDQTVSGMFSMHRITTEPFLTPSAVKARAVLSIASKSCAYVNLRS